MLVIFGSSRALFFKSVDMQRKTLDPGLRRDDGGSFSVAFTTTVITCMS
jgi:hypothetical protein